MTMILMLIWGGSPGSTAGGMKTMNFAVYLQMPLQYFEKAECKFFMDEE